MDCGISISLSYLNTTLFTGNVHKRHEHSKGISPPPIRFPPETITPLKVIQLLERVRQDENTLIQLLKRYYLAIPLKRRGGQRDQVLSPSFTLRVLIILYHKKEFSWAIFLKQEIPSLKKQQSGIPGNAKHQGYHAHTSIGNRKKLKINNSDCHILERTERNVRYKYASMIMVKGNTG